MCLSSNVPYIVAPVEALAIQYAATSGRPQPLNIISCVKNAPLTPDGIGSNGDLYDHYSDVKMDAIASQNTTPTIVYSNVYWGAD